MINSKYTALDSLQLRIDMQFVKLTPKGEDLLRDEYCLVNINTGEEREGSLKKYAYANKEKGITSRFSVRKAGYNQKINNTIKEVPNFKNEKEKAEYEKCWSTLVDSDMISDSEDLEMIINSKMLKSKYIYGITKNTIRHLYRYIIDQGFFTVSFRDFALHSRCTDIDIKTDLHNFDTEKTVKFFTGLNIVSPTKALSLNPEKEIIIQYGHRTNVKRIANNPFIKLYHKMVELQYNSLEFYREHLSPIYGSSQSKDNLLKNICRIEGTIKDNGHLKSLLKTIGLEYKSSCLWDLLMLTENNLKSIISIFLNKQIKVSQKVTTMEKMQSNNSLTLSDKNTISAIKLEILEGGSIDTYIFNTCQNLSRNSRYSYRKKFIDLYKEFLINDNEVTQKNDFRQLLNSILNMA